MRNCAARDFPAASGTGFLDGDYEAAGSGSVCGLENVKQEA
jgi:hypothetical protein